jgi:lambda repressor-like predicted transcriptional regulator
MNFSFEAEWPFEPILALVRVKINKESPTNKDVSKATGVSERRVRNARELGYVDNSWVADKMACRLGTHPTLVWPDFYDTADAWFGGDLKDGLITKEQILALTKVVPPDKVEA